jgi:hypothetical protein
MKLFKTKEEKMVEEEERVNGILYKEVHMAILIRDYPEIAKDVRGKTCSFIDEHSLEKKTNVINMVLNGYLSEEVHLLDLFENTEVKTNG